MDFKRGQIVISTAGHDKGEMLVVADFDKKLDIMKAIGESCGIHTEAKGIIVSTPIDAVVGLDNTL